VSEPSPLACGPTPHGGKRLFVAVATANRTRQLVDDADREVVLVVGNETVYTDALVSRPNAAGDRGVSVIVAVPTRT